nr:MAG TPA: rubredoxin iron binding domains containing a [Caudoviricetes sp.]
MRRRREEQNDRPQYRCRDCAHSYDWSNTSFHDGLPILCRCRFDSRTKHGLFCKFLNDRQCEHFTLRSANADAATK